MILAALNDYYQRLLDDPTSTISRPGYSREKIGFEIVLAPNGSVTNIVDLRDHSGKKPIEKSLSVPASFKRPGIGSKAFFLWDKTSYAFGIGKNSDRASQDHAAFGALHRQALADSNDPGLNALLALLDKWSPQRFQSDALFLRQEEAMLDANVVFRLDGDEMLLHERPAARAAWSRLSGTAADAEQSICLVTGERAPIARLHPAIKGVNGAQSMGASIVSFNLDAFTSYGKQQGENAPISEQAAFGYTTALNHLLRRDPGNRQRLQLGDATVVFWAQAPDRADAEEAEDVFAAFMDPRDDDRRATARLGDALEQIRKQRPLRELGGHLEDGTRLFVLGLAPNASRLSIRFWETATLAHFVKRLASHYDDLELKPSRWLRRRWPQALALATAPIYDGRAKAEDISPLLAGELARAIFHGTRYPRSVLSAIVLRLRADGAMTDTRVALCKAVLARDARLNHAGMDKGAPPVSLDLDNADPGYLLGRLFSSLENIQRAALGGQINATIRDRYYGAASATPAGVFPVLLRNTQNHLGRLRKDKPAFAKILEKEIGQIIDALEPAFPRSLPIEAQGRFAIGYYHQTQARFARADGKDATDDTAAGEAA